MSQEHHKARAPRQVRVFVLTVSDTRTEADDVGGQLCRELLQVAGHSVTGWAIVRDDPQLVSAHVLSVLEAGSADVLISTGGTGISQRDTTYEALSGLLSKRLDGFGELFRMLSYQDIGSAAMLSRAVGGGSTRFSGRRLLCERAKISQGPGSSGCGITHPSPSRARGSARSGSQNGSASIAGGSAIGDPSLRCATTLSGGPLTSPRRPE